MNVCVCVHVLTLTCLDTCKRMPGNCHSIRHVSGGTACLAQLVQRRCSSTVASNVANYDDPQRDETRITQTRDRSRQLALDEYTRSPLQDSRLFGPSPWKILATTYEQKGFLSNPAPGENLVSGNLVMETGCSATRGPLPRRGLPAPRVGRRRGAAWVTTPPQYESAPAKGAPGPTGTKSFSCQQF